jgi:hypothetical protein
MIVLNVPGNLTDGAVSVSAAKGNGPTVDGTVGKLI